MKKKIALIVSCEHAVDTVPEPYLSLFAPFELLLASHRGVDFGASAIAENLKKHITCDLVQAVVTRLLIDCNKSLNHRRCFSKITRDLPLDEKQSLISNYYLPFRQKVMNLIRKNIEEGSQVWHFSIHSFTPVMNHVVRNADIGLLYDPKRLPEKLLARQWKKEIMRQSSQYKIRMNYPYKGISDGFTSAMRKDYTSQEYIGLEVEANQALAQNTQTLDALKNTLAISLLNLLCYY